MGAGSTALAFSTTVFMIGKFAFDPDSGAPLSEGKLYPTTRQHYRTGVRTPVEHDHSAWSDSREGALTNGEVRSSREGLQGYFERSLRTVCTDPDPRLDMISQTATRQLKKDDNETADCYLWYALAERLRRKGYWSTWMLDYATPRCPLCTRSGSETKFRPGVWFQEAICATKPSEHGCVDEAIREKVLAVYNSAFDDPKPLATDDDPIDELAFL